MPQFPHLWKIDYCPLTPQCCSRGLNECSAQCPKHPGFYKTRHSHSFPKGADMPFWYPARHTQTHIKTQVQLLLVTDRPLVSGFQGQPSQAQAPHPHPTFHFSNMVTSFHSVDQELISIQPRDYFLSIPMYDYMRESRRFSLLNKPQIRIHTPALFSSSILLPSPPLLSINNLQHLTGFPIFSIVPSKHWNHL